MNIYKFFICLFCNKLIYVHLVSGVTAHATVTAHASGLTNPAQSHILEHIYTNILSLEQRHHFDRISMPENYTCVVCRCASEPASSYFSHFLASNVFFRHPPSILSRLHTIPSSSSSLPLCNSRNKLAVATFNVCAIRNICQMHKTNLSASC